MRERELSALLDLGDRVVAEVSRRRRNAVSECVVRTGSELSAKVRMGVPERVEERMTTSVGLRLLDGRRGAMASSHDVSEAGLGRLLDEAIELVELVDPDDSSEAPDPGLLCDPSSIVDLELWDPAVAALSAPDAIARATATEAVALGCDPRIAHTDGAICKRTRGAVAYVFSAGLRAAYRTTSLSLGVTPVALDRAGKRRRASQWTTARHAADTDDGASVARQAVRQTLAKLGARTVAPCEVPVIFDPQAGRSVLSTLSHCVMGNTIWRRSSYLSGREGTRVASELVTIVDDALVPRGPGSRPFDGEGLASRKTVVVDHGVLATYLCASDSARKLRRESTASAARGASAGVHEAASNFMLLPGPDAPDAIIKGTRRGLYVTDLQGVGFNALTGNFSRGAAGFWIENGELAFPVNEVTISLDIDTLWKRIDAVGSDLKLRTSTEAPTFRVAKMTVAGAAPHTEQGQ